jgi:hypothetical protein
MSSAQNVGSVWGLSKVRGGVLEGIVICRKVGLKAVGGVWVARCGWLGHDGFFPTYPRFSASARHAEKVIYSVCRMD